MKKFNLYLCSFSLFCTGFSSCTDKFDDINTNPYVTTEIEPKLLLTNAFSRGALEYSTYYYSQNYANFLSQYFTSTNLDMVHNTDRYRNNDAWNTTFWDRNFTDSDYQGFLMNAHLAMGIAHAKGDMPNQEGPAKIYRAFQFLRLTDCFGPLPYSQYFQDGIVKPKYDSQENIYVDLLQQLKEGVAMLDESKGKRMGTSDIMFKDDLNRWRQFGNSLILRIAIRLSNVPSFENTARMAFEEALNAPGGVITETKSYAGFSWPKTGPAREHDQNPWMVITNSFPKWYKVSETFLKMLSDLKDPRQFTYIGLTNNYINTMSEEFKKLAARTDINDGERLLVDSVIGAITDRDLVFSYGEEFFNRLEKLHQLKTGKVASDPIYRRYKGVRNGLTAEKVGNIQDNLDNYSNVSPLIKAWDYPTYFITAAEVSFLKSEATLKGWNTGNTAEFYYKEGIKNSFLQYSLSQTKIDNYLKSITLKPGNELEQIITQKYIANYTNGFESWAEWRRTGFPRLLTIDDAAGGETNGEVPRRWIFPRNESRYNYESYSEACSKLLKGDDNMNTTLWWDTQYKTSPVKWKLLDNYDYSILK